MKQDRNYFQKASQSTKDSFNEMYKDLTDDDRIAENKRKHDIEQIKKDKIADTGLGL